MDKTKEIWTIGAILKWTGQYFQEKGVDNPRLDAEVLLSHILGQDRLHLYVHFDQPLTRGELASFREMVKKRAGRMSVAYIIGHKEFMGLDFLVSPAVLVPRPDTEILVEAVSTRLGNFAAPRILDIGTGSGAILISLLKSLPSGLGTAVDISPEALAVAKKNAQSHGVNERAQFCLGNVFEPVAGQVFDCVVSNPPYIPDGELAALAPEVRGEPQLALAGGVDGLDFYRRIISEGAIYLAAGGLLVLEVGAGQAREVALLAENTPLKNNAIIKDYAGIERVVLMVKE
ncbi:MAG: peptide chain release factor N(5)-glutamine methyltransferase [Pelosinus sp.]|nr:peptide chain release factor N(5)-glutamine methyltransferase [Pelosinus sp.]